MQNFIDNDELILVRKIVKIKLFYYYIVFV